MPPRGFRALFRLLLALSALRLGLAHAGSAGQRPIAEQQVQQRQQVQEIFSADPAPGQRCAQEVPVGNLELSAEERELLQFVCWPEDAAPAGVPSLLAGPPRGVPPGVNCTVVSWCDGGACTEVCERGSVVVEPWLAHAIRQQTRLVQTLPLCYATLLGTHNSAISLADGYGNLDEYFQGFFKHMKWVPGVADSQLHTNNQLLSLTDQLNLGVRALELDTHWIGGTMRIAHCGGLHVPQLNKLIDLLNLLARLFHRPIRWDTETLGCVPSLSSIPAMEQRLLTDALEEIRAWMDDPANADEFLLLYFDDQPNLQTWGVVGRLLSDLLSVMPEEWIFMADDLAAAGGAWPSQRAMLDAGKRLLLVSGTDYGAAMQPLVFARGAGLCGWSEPSLAWVDGAPMCQVTDQGGIEPRPLFDGLLTRVISCELQYGPLSCEFVWRGTNQPVFDEVTLPPVMGCGLNQPSPDLLTPDRAAAAVWTWAPGHPFDPTADDDAGRGGAADAAAAAPANCGVLSASDSRWRAVPCTLRALPSACRRADAALDAADGGWVVDGSRRRGDCPEGTQYDLPRHPRENYLLAAALRQGGYEAAWLPVHGPDWSTDGWPAARQQPQPTSARRVVLRIVLPAAGGLGAAGLAAAGLVLGRRALLRRRQPALYQALDKA